MATFRENLSKTGKGVLDARAKNLAEMTKIEADRKLQEYHTIVLRIKNEIADHEDLAVTSRDSLKPGGSNFNSEEWVKKGCELELKLRDAIIEYKVIKKWHDRLFPEDEDDLALNDDIDIEEDK